MRERIASWQQRQILLYFFKLKKNYLGTNKGTRREKREEGGSEGKNAKSKHIKKIKKK